MVNSVTLTQSTKTLGPALYTYVVLQSQLATPWKNQAPKNTKTEMPKPRLHSQREEKKKEHISSTGAYLDFGVNFFVLF